MDGWMDEWMGGWASRCIIPAYLLIRIPICLPAYRFTDHWKSRQETPCRLPWCNTGKQVSQWDSDYIHLSIDAQMNE